MESRMIVDFVNPFIEAVLHILETTAQVAVKARRPYLKRGLLSAGDISGIISVSGDIEGCVVVAFSKPCILGIVSAMFGEEMTEIGDDIKDAVGEISNMVAGQVTTKMTEMGKTVQIKLSEVIIGEGGKVVFPEKRPIVSIPFMTDHGGFIIEICFSA